VTNDEPVPLRDTLAAVQRDLGAPSPDAFAVVEAVWREVAGPELATRARVRSVRDGECTIEVDGGVWATRTRYVTGGLLEAANARLGKPILAAVKVVVIGPRRSG
jgi:predicted nucleic acid-binding Zn ribbon protein